LPQFSAKYESKFKFSSAVPSLSALAFDGAFDCRLRGLRGKLLRDRLCGATLGAGLGGSLCSSVNNVLYCKLVKMSANAILRTNDKTATDCIMYSTLRCNLYVSYTAT
jgi:hypothetical protein